MARYTHHTTDHPSLSTAELAASAQNQVEESLPRYHYLRAAVTGAYEIERANPVPSLVTLKFERYEDYDLEPLLDLKVSPNADGSVHPDDLKMYKEELFGNWKVREAGILYVMRMYRQFWNMLLSYNSPARTTGLHAWDAMFDEWKDAGCPMEMVPCMWFARPCGCMDPACQFLHDAESTRRDKALVHVWRRAQCGKLTAEDIAALRDADPTATSPGDDGFIVRKIQLHIEHPEPAKCWNPACSELNSHPNAAVQYCSCCQVVSYCSRNCQLQHWRAHKRDCRPYEQIIHDDDLWSRIGCRNGLQRNGSIVRDDSRGLRVTMPPGFGQ
ncbi:hypothetical protein PENSPDRAFT_755313 [Peniophora sp. CONT]|nr:hypothetical protein PENSPDRAFT_755313 [Peniophora sp. CONT]